jgi:hypothetical protein
MPDSISNLLETPFSRRSFVDKLELVKNGRDLLQIYKVLLNRVLRTTENLQGIFKRICMKSVNGLRDVKEKTAFFVGAACSVRIEIPLG